MARDFRKLRVFQIADELILDIYKETRSLPVEERYGLQSQIRRAAVATATNIVEGAARKTDRDYCNFLNIAVGSASETRYLLNLAGRLGFVSAKTAAALDERCRELVGGLVRLVDAVDRQLLAAK